MIKKYILIVTVGLLSFCYNASAQQTFTEEEIEEFVQSKAEYCNCEEDTKENRNVSYLANNGSMTVMFSGGLNYLYGTQENGNSSYNQDYASWFGEVMIGYQYYGKNKRSGSTIGIFGAFGNTSEKALEKMAKSSSIEDEIDLSQDNFYLNLEAGVVLLQALRLSTGIGTQRYYLSNNNKERLSYFSTTAGLRIGPENFKIMPALNILYGRELTETIYRPQLQIGIKF